MTFNLFLFKTKGTELHLADVTHYFESVEHFSVKALDSDSYYFEYHNPNTNVVFVILYKQLEELPNNITMDQGLEFSKVSFVMGYLRPSFYGLEAFPILHDFCTQFNLNIHDPQNPGNKDAIINYSVEELIRSYDNNNEMAVLDFYKQDPVLSLSKEKSLQAYQYMKNINQLAEKYGETLDVSEISFMRHKKEKKVYTVISWYYGNPILLPKVDYVIIVKEYKSFLKKKEKSSIVHYDTILSTFAPYLHKVEEDLFIINENVLDLFNQLPEQSLDNYILINTDDFVDIEINE